MHGRVPRAVVAVVTAVSFLFLSMRIPPLPADDHPAGWYTILAPKGFGLMKEFLGGVEVSDQAGVLFYVKAAKDLWSPPYSIAAFSIDTEGKAGDVNTIVEGLQYETVTASAVYTGGAAARPAGSVAGLLFFGRHAAADASEFDFFVAPFDADGKLAGNITKLFSAKAPTNYRVSDPTIRATAGGASVCAALSFQYTDFGYQPRALRSEVLILATDLAGRLLSGPTAAKLPDGGAGWYHMVGFPAWTKKSWLIPLTGNGNNPVPGARAAAASGNHLSLLAAKAKGSAFKIKLKRVESDSQTNVAYAYDNLYFVPLGAMKGPSPAAVNRTLAYKYSEFSEGGTDDPREYVSEFNLRDVKKSGAAGPPRALMFDEWVTSLRLQGGNDFGISFENFARPIALPNGAVLTVLERVVEVVRGSPTVSTLDKEGSMTAYVFDPKTGEATAVQTQDPFAAPPSGSLDGKTLLILFLVLYLIFVAGGWGTTPDGTGMEGHYIFIVSMLLENLLGAGF